MFWGVNRGRRAKAASKRAIEEKTPSAMSPGFENPTIVRFCVAMRRRRGTSRSTSFANTTESEGKTATAEIANRAIKNSNNPATAEDQFAGVKHPALAGGDGALRLIETHFDARRIGGGRDGRRGGLVLVSDLDLATHGR